jgi:hypothetical protein
MDAPVCSGLVLVLGWFCANAAMPMPMPRGVVIANSIDSVVFSQSNFHGWRRGTGEDVRQEEEDGKSKSESREGGDGGGCVVGGSEAIRIPRESPSNSWWKMIAVTRDTGNCG